MKKYTIIISVFVLLVISLVFCIHGWNKTLKNEKRLEANQETLLGEVELYKTESGKNAASVTRLELTKKELEQHKAALVKTVDDLNIKLKRVQSVSTTSSQADYDFQAPVEEITVNKPDTVPDRPPVLERIQKVEYDNTWLKFSGTIREGIFRGNISSIDTIDQVVHKVPRQFLFFRYGCKAIRQEVVSRNPYNRITYTEYIELKK